MQSGRSQRSLLGVSLGATVGTVSAAVIVWPIADLVIAPVCIAECMHQTPSPPSGLPATEKDVKRLLTLGASSDGARVVVLAGGTHQQRQALAYAARAQRRRSHRLSFRTAVSPHTMQMTLIEQLYSPISVAPLFSALGVFWLSLFDMLISDHAHTRQRDFCVVLGQLRRAMRGVSVVNDTPLASFVNRRGGVRVLPPPPLAVDRPLLVIEGLHVPSKARAQPGGEALAPMLRNLDQYLCSVAAEEGLADVLVLCPVPSAASANAVATWRGEAGRAAAERVVLSNGVVAVALTQAEAIERGLEGIARL